jgi:hypothetical protein
MLSPVWSLFRRLFWDTEPTRQRGKTIPTYNRKVNLPWKGKELTVYVFVDHNIGAGCPECWDDFYAPPTHAEVVEVLQGQVEHSELKDELSRFFNEIISDVEWCCHDCDGPDDFEELDWVTKAKEVEI